MQNNTIEAFGLVVKLVLKNGIVLESTKTGNHESWYNAWAQLEPAFPQDLVLAVQVEDEMGEFFTYTANHFDRPNGEPHFQLLDVEDRTAMLVVREDDKWVNGANICVVKLGASRFDTFEVSIQRTAGWCGVIIQKTWHGNLFNKGGTFCCPRLEREHVSYRALRGEIRTKYLTGDLPRFVNEYSEHFEDHLKLSMLNHEEYVVTAMACTGRFFCRDRRGNLILGHINQVVGKGCPVPTVGTILTADLRNNQGKKELCNIQFLESEKFLKMLSEKTVRVPEGMRTFRKPRTVSLKDPFPELARAMDEV